MINNLIKFGHEKIKPPHLKIQDMGVLNVRLFEITSAV